MKKIMIILVGTGLVLASASCKRTDIDNPPWDGPVGFNVLLEGSASPAELFIDGNIHTTSITVRVTDSKGRPLVGAIVFFEQLADSGSHQQLEWGYFENNLPTIQKTTNANGEVRVTFYGPVQYKSGIMFIHALMIIDGRAYRGSSSHIGNIPEDFIALGMINSAGGR